jgi:hypothetical protein
MRLFQCHQKGEEYVGALAMAAASADTMDVDVSELRDDYKILSEPATTLLWEISQTMVTQSEEVAAQFKDMSWVTKSSATIFGRLLQIYELMLRISEMPSPTE